MSPAKNRQFKVALKKPSPDALLQTVHRILGWHPPITVESTHKPSKSLYTTQVYKHLLSPPTKPTHSCSLLNFIDSIENNQLSDDAFQKFHFREQNSVEFSLPQLTFFNGLYAFRLSLAKLTLQVCRHRCDAQGLRLFIEKYLPELSKKWPSIQWEIQQRNGHEPVLRARYISGAEHVIDVGNKTLDQIQEYVKMLIEKSGESWLRGRRFRQGVIGRASATRPIWNHLEMQWDIKHESKINPLALFKSETLAQNND